jgi:hypothetical protein
MTDSERDLYEDVPAVVDLWDGGPGVMVTW